VADKNPPPMWESMLKLGDTCVYRSPSKPSARFKYVGTHSMHYVIEWLDGELAGTVENVTRFWMECHCAGIEGRPDSFGRHPNN
jgi:hypothetical protein